jgi:DNA-binding transcriptional MerR regulator
MEENKQFKTNDAKKATGLTERQLKDWHQNEASKKRQEGEWRKYTTADVIILKILAELRKNGIELNSLEKLKKWLHTEDAIDYLLKKMHMGFSMYLCTNLVDYFGFEDDSEGYDFVFLINNHVDKQGKVEIDKPITVLPLNGIVEDVLRRLNIGKDFNTKPNKQLSLPKLTQLMQKDTDLTIQEKKLLELLKEKDFQNLIVKVKEGKIVHINREESITLDN